jgi:kinesin family protein 6/9
MGMSHCRFSSVSALTPGPSCQVRGLTRRPVSSEEAALGCFFEGEGARSTAAHILNAASSRSHCIFTLHVEAEAGVGSAEKVTSSKLHLVDLAGSERLKKTHVTGESLREATAINKSLTFLEQVGWAAQLEGCIQGE